MTLGIFSLIAVGIAAGVGVYLWVSKGHAENERKRASEDAWHDRKAQITHLTDMLKVAEDGSDEQTKLIHLLDEMNLTSDEWLHLSYQGFTRNKPVLKKHIISQMANSATGEHAPNR